jgi:hypothetical protein
MGPHGTKLDWAQICAGCASPSPIAMMPTATASYGGVEPERVENGSSVIRDSRFRVLYASIRTAEHFTSAAGLLELPLFKGEIAGSAAWELWGCSF